MVVWNHLRVHRVTVPQIKNQPRVTSTQDARLAHAVESNLRRDKVFFVCLFVCFYFNINSLTFKQRAAFSVKGQLEGKIECTIGPTQWIAPTQEQTKQFVLLFCSSPTTMCSLGSPCTLTWVAIEWYLKMNPYDTWRKNKSHTPVSDWAGSWTQRKIALSNRDHFLGCVTCW